MKAFLLAAGEGVRLRPITHQTPKCLIPVDGMPLLGIWFRLLRWHGVDSVLVNTHHLAEQVEAYVSGIDLPGIEIHLSYEPKLLGSAGTVSRNRDFVKDEDSFFILYADNLTDVNLREFHDFHCRANSPFTVGLFETDEPDQCGIATRDETGIVTEFVEKPSNPTSRLANTGMYVGTDYLFDILPDREFMDFGRDVLPLMLGKMFGFTISGFLCDTGAPHRLERARREWPLRADRSFLRNE